MRELIISNVADYQPATLPKYKVIIYLIHEAPGLRKNSFWPK